MITSQGWVKFMILSRIFVCNQSQTYWLSLTTSLPFPCANKEKLEHQTMREGSQMMILADRIRTGMQHTHTKKKGGGGAPKTKEK